MQGHALYAEGKRLFPARTTLLYRQCQAAELSVAASRKLRSTVNAIFMAKNLANPRPRPRPGLQIALFRLRYPFCLPIFRLSLGADTHGPFLAFISRPAWLVQSLAFSSNLNDSI